MTIIDKRHTFRAVILSLLASTVMSSNAIAQSSDNFEKGVRNNEGWSFLNAARNFDSYYDQSDNCVNADLVPSFQCIDARLESALNFINAGKFTEGQNRITEARKFAGSAGDPDVISGQTLNYGSLYARSFQYDALKDLRSGASASQVASKTAAARQYRQQIRDGLRNFDGQLGSLDGGTLLADASGNFTISPGLASRISPKFDMSPARKSGSDIGATYGRFSTSRGQQLGIQDAQSFLIEAFAYGQEKNSALALAAISSAEQSLNATRGMGNALAEPVSIARAPFLWAMIKSEKANHEILSAGNDTNAKSRIADRFEADVVDGIFGSAYQDTKLRGLMLLRLAEFRAQSGEFIQCSAETCGLDAVKAGVKVLRSNIDSPTVANEWTEPLLAAIYDNKDGIEDWESEFFNIMQVASQSEVAADAAEAVIRLKQDEGSPLGQALKEIDRLQFSYRDADRELEIMRARRIAGESIPDEVFQAKQTQVLALSESLDATRSAFQKTDAGKRFAQLVSTSVDLETIQNALDGDEGYSRIVLGEDRGFSILISADGVAISSIDQSRDKIQKSVEVLRCAVDFVDAFKQYTCAQNSSEEFPYDARFPEYDVKIAANLFEDIYGGIQKRLLGGEIKHLIVQPDPILAPLPFSALVTTPSSEITANSVKHVNFDNNGYDHDYTRVSWLSDSVAVSHSVGELSFVQARDKSRSGVGVRAPKPFLGFSGFERFEPGEARQISQKKKVNSTTCDGVYRGFLDIAESTNRQAQAIQDQIGGDLVLGSEFTDTGILNRSDATTGSALKDYRVLLFATHSISPGPLTEGCLDEPILTTNFDASDPMSDGFLTASDIASGMELAADLVILSACETAVGSAVSTFSDRPTAETFDGIVRAFYFAQAQSILATHWTLPANETVSVFSQLFEREGLAEIDIAERLRQTQVITRNGSHDGKSTSHPYFWANFVFVGDGRTKLDL